jgi:sulfotransferase
MKIFFNSSMPRSGSTLMQNILGNNPDIYATPTSGLVDLLISSKKAYTQSAVFKAQDEEQMKSAYLHFCAYGIHGYFQGLTDKPYVVDKSRAWAINKPFLDCFYPNAKVICMVRDLRDIIASMEKNYRKYPDKWDMSSDDPPKGVTVGERVSLWMKAKPVGTTLTQLKEVFHRGLDKDILFVRFEDLCEEPEYVMEQVHNYLEIPKFNYDFNDIKQVTHEDDKFHGRYGDHKIKNSITPVESKANQLLGQFLCDELYKRNQWYFKKFNYEK